ncbi:MAG: xylulokinase [Clostridiales Family XIII bacterium]|jgi:xylulokinase|nr:xylulokinase [Clostridiales Family XIII bacterium]
MTERALLGIDVGTSGTKVLLVSESGKVLARHTEEYEMYQPKNGWAEQDPADWWDATAKGIKAVIAETGMAPASVGLSGQMHGLVMLDSSGDVLRRSIIWCDQRTEAEVEDMERILGRQRIIEITANPPMTGFTAAKILWVKKNEPEIYEKCAHILLPKDYIRYRLTGEFATEVSDASGMQLMDVAGRQWSGEVLAKLGIEASMLASMYESEELTGKVTKEAAGATGLAEGTPVAGGAGDNPAAAIGTGVVSEGRAFTTVGSSAVIYAVSDEVRIDMQGRVHSLCASVPGKWTVMSCTQGAGLSLQWLRNNVCNAERQEAERLGVSAYDLMGKLAEGVPPGSDKLLFLPYLMGERSPHPDPDCRGVFFGLSARHGKANLIRSVIEGVSFSQLECLNVFREMGVSVGDMIMTGGGAASPLWRQLLADLYECPVSTLEANEGAALGAAILGGVAAGIYSSCAEGCEAHITRGAAVAPDAGMRLAYEPYYQLYRKLYHSLRDDFKTLAKIEA